MGRCHLNLPLVAPVGTVVLISVGEAVVNVAAVPSRSELERHSAAEAGAVRQNASEKSDAIQCA